VDDLVRAMGMEGISRSQVSRLCAGIDERVHDFLARPIVGEPPSGSRQSQPDTAAQPDRDHLGATPRDGTRPRGHATDDADISRRRSEACQLTPNACPRPMPRGTPASRDRSARKKLRSGRTGSWAPDQPAVGLHDRQTASRGGRLRSLSSAQHARQHPPYQVACTGLGLASISWKMHGARTLT
jgi:hypothetical protein